jgi:hypothetical protein
MTVKELEQRVAALEQQVKQLQSQRNSASDHHHDWEATVNKFKNDEHLQAVFAEAMKLREKERRAIHKKRGTGTRVKP